MILWHGTTRQRAESIVANGPDPRYDEGGSPTPPFGFFMMPPATTDEIGTPAEYATGKANNFLTEGGPVILEVDVPDEIAALAQDCWPSYGFETGFGLERLLQVWHGLPKRVIDV